MSDLPTSLRIGASPALSLPTADDPLTGVTIATPDVATAHAKPSGRSQEILLALPKDDYLKALSAYLRKQGLTVIETETARATIVQALTGEKIGVIVTADDLPDLPGMELLARLRDLGVATPIALLVDAYSEVREEVALECGAAEFLCRSQRHSIVAKRLSLLAAGSKRNSRQDPSATENLKVGRLLLKSHCHRALWRGREVPLTITEVRIVRLLACRAGTTISYREIYDVVHGAGFRAGEGTDGFRTNVRSLIRKIRRRFHTIDHGFDEIENHPGIGYCWRSAPAAQALPPPARSSMTD
ncbi:MAG: response regulator [Alphaproteobacteria bacterium]|nr:response regulator [Alphaproteobacteria bacterium]